jgi:voltage-gated potassium channel Kch
MNVLLHGSDRLGTAIEHRLAAAGCQVTKRGPDGAQAFALDERALRSTSVLVLAADDDAANVDLALTARRMRSDLPLVVRVFDEALAAYLQKSLDGVTILSMSALAAPVFGDATLRAIADREARRPDTVPSASNSAARALRLRSGQALRLRSGQALRLRSRRADFDRAILVAILFAMAAIVLTFTLFFANALDLSYVDAMYFVMTTVTTVGYGDIALRDASTPVKIVGMIMMFAGAAFIALLFGLFTDWVVSRRLEIAAGRVRVRGNGHIVIAGSGNVGVRVAEGLREKDHRVVIIERNADNKNIEVLRANGHHVILADAARAATLSLAKVEDSAAMLCLTDSDAVNFQIALLIRARSADVPIIIKVVSPELSTHVSEHGHAVAISPIAIAAEEFAKAALSASGMGRPGGHALG